MEMALIYKKWREYETAQLSSGKIEMPIEEIQLTLAAAISFEPQPT